MSWFARLCRNTGLMIHHVKKPATGKQTLVVRHETEEQQVDETVTLRRTTIEEVEVTRGSKQDDRNNPV